MNNRKNVALLLHYYTSMDTYISPLQLTLCKLINSINPQIAWETWRRPEKDSLFHFRFFIPGTKYEHGLVTTPEKLLDDVTECCKYLTECSMELNEG